MELLLLLTLLSAMLPSIKCSRGQSDQYNNSITEFNRNIPVSPVQAYRKKLKAIIHPEPVRHAVRPFPIVADLVSDREYDNHVGTSTPSSGNNIDQPVVGIRGLPKPYDGESNFVSLDGEPAPVYKDARAPSAPATFARSSDHSFNFQPGSTTRPITAVNEGSVANGPAYDIDPTSATNIVVTDADSNSLESKVVEFRNCLMKDSDRVWKRPVRNGSVFVPRNEIESTCRVYIEKMEQMRERCMESLEAVLAAKTKSPVSQKKDSNKSWWRFLTFG